MEENPYQSPIESPQNKRVLEVDKAGLILTFIVLPPAWMLTGFLVWWAYQNYIQQTNLIFYVFCVYELVVSMILVPASFFSIAGTFYFVEQDSSPHDH